MRDVLVGDRPRVQLAVVVSSSKQRAARPPRCAWAAEPYHVRLNNERSLYLRHGSQKNRRPYAMRFCGQLGGL